MSTTIVEFPPEGGAGRLSETVSIEVATLMGRYHVTQAQLATYLHLTRSAISHRLTNRTPWRLDEVEHLAEGFGVHPAELQGGYTGKKPRRSAEALPLLCAIRDSNPEPADYWPTLAPVLQLPTRRFEVEQ